MLRKEYIVMLRIGQWWVVVDGARLGPYLSQQVAAAAAVRMAKLDFRTGRHARVSVDDPNDGVPVIYDSADI